MVGWIDESWLRKSKISRVTRDQTPTAPIFVMMMSVFHCWGGKAPATGFSRVWVSHKISHWHFRDVRGVYLLYTLLYSIFKGKEAIASKEMLRHLAATSDERSFQALQIIRRVQNPINH